MKVVRHDNEFVQVARAPAIVIKNVDKEPGPIFLAEEFATFRCSRRDEIRLPVVRSRALVVVSTFFDFSG
jgi:hypothetical protein